MIQKGVDCKRKKSPVVVTILIDFFDFRATDPVHFDFGVTPLAATAAVAATRSDKKKKKKK